MAFRRPSISRELELVGVFLLAVVLDREQCIRVRGIDSPDERAKVVVNLELQDGLGKSVRSKRLQQQRLHVALGWHAVPDSIARVRLASLAMPFSPRRA